MALRPLAYLALAALALTAVYGSISDADVEGNRLMITGSSTVAPLASEIAKRFESLHPGVRIDVQTGGSSRGITDAQSGVADIGMVSRALDDGELGLLSFPIAHDGVAVIVHADNPVPSLTRDQVRRVYRGEIHRWSELGGAEAPITVVNKAAGRATLEVFLGYFELEPTEVRADVVIGDNEHGVKTVAGNPHAIGFVSIGTIRANADAGIPVRPLPVGEPLAAGPSAAGTLTRPLNLVTPRRPDGLAREFIEYARSDAVRDLVEALYFVPVAP